MKESRSSKRTRRGNKCNKMLTDFRFLSEKEKSESLARQMKDLQERVKNLQADREIVEQDKKYLQETLKKYDDKIMDLEYQAKKK